MSRNTRVALEDQLLAALAEHGPLTTGKLRQLTGAHYKNARVAHGRLTRTDPNTQGLAAQTPVGDLPRLPMHRNPGAGRRLGDTTRPSHPETAGKKRAGGTYQVAGAHNYGGDMWIRLDPGPTQERSRGLEL